MESLITNESEYFEINNMLQDEITMLINKCNHILEYNELSDEVYNLREELISFEYEYTEQNSYYVEEIYNKISEIEEVVKEDMDVESMLVNC